MKVSNKLLIPALFLLCPSAVGQPCEYETCGFEVGDTYQIGSCLQRSIDDGGQANNVQDAMLSIYNSVQSDFLPVQGTDEALLRGFNAAKPGANAHKSEGLYFCVEDAPRDTDAFYWVLNCGVLSEGGTGDYSLCDNLTADEQTLEYLGYVVDSVVHGDTKFHRYVFDSKTVVKTVDQPLEGSDFICSERPWFRTSTCTSPLALTCPTGFEGTTGRGAFQYYGKVEVSIVAQDIREWHLSPCLDGEDDDNTGWIVAVSVVCGVFALVIIYLTYRLTKLSNYTTQLKREGKAVPRMSSMQKMSSIRMSVSSVVENAMKESASEENVAESAVQEQSPMPVDKGVDAAIPTDEEMQGA